MKAAWFGYVLWLKIKKAYFEQKQPAARMKNTIYSLSSDSITPLKRKVRYQCFSLIAYCWYVGCGVGGDI